MNSAAENETEQIAKEEQSGQAVKSAQAGQLGKSAQQESPKKVENRLVTGVLWKELLIFFAPLLAGTFFQMLYNTVDTIVVGRFVGKEALSAVGGATGTLINLFVGFFVGITSGETVVISQYYGAKRIGEVREAMHTGIGIALAGGLILTVVVEGLARIMLVAMDTPADTLEWSVLYLRIFAVGMIGNMLYNMAASILRGTGDSRRPFLYLVAGTLTNIVLDCLFVIVLHWGVAGVAVATILSQYMSAVLGIGYLIRTKECCHLSPRRINLNPSYAGKILRIGIPAAFQSLMYSISNVLIQTAVDGFGTNTVAAWTVWGKIDSLFWMIINSFGLATTTVIGQNYGAGKFLRVRRCTREALAMISAFTAAMGCFLYFCRYPLFRIFTSDETVVEIGVQLAEFMAPVFITYVCIEILSGSLRGMGDALVPTLITVIGVCMLRIVWLYTAVPVSRTMQTVMMSYPLSWVISSIAFIIYFEYYVKKHDIRKDRG